MCVSVCVCTCVCRLQEEVRQSVAPAEPVQYYFTLAQQPGAVQVQGQQQGQQASAQTATTIQPGQIIIAQPQQGQVLMQPSSQGLFIFTNKRLMVNKGGNNTNCKLVWACLFVCV